MNGPHGASAQSSVEVERGTGPACVSRIAVTYKMNRAIPRIATQSQNYVVGLATNSSTLSMLVTVD